VELCGETPNATWRGAIVRNLLECRQGNFSQEIRFAFRSPHGNDKVIYEIKLTANSWIALCSSKIHSAFRRHARWNAFHRDERPKSRSSAPRNRRLRPSRYRTMWSFKGLPNLFATSKSAGIIVARLLMLEKISVRCSYPCFRGFALFHEVDSRTSPNSASKTHYGLE